MSHASLKDIAMTMTARTAHGWRHVWRRAETAIARRAVQFFYSYGSVSVFEVGIGFSVFFSVFL